MDSNSKRNNRRCDSRERIPAREFFEEMLLEIKGSPEGRRAEELYARCNVSLGVSVGIDPDNGRDVFQLNEDRYRHTLIIGRTGAGKSNHITQMEREDIRNGAGVFILAAHEDDALYPLSCVPEERLGDVVFIDTSNPEYLPCMNPLGTACGMDAANKAVNDVLELLTMDCKPDWAGPRFEHYLRNGIGLLMQDPDPSSHCVSDLNRLYTDPEFVKGLLKYCTDKDIYDFWTAVFPPATKASDHGDTIAWFLAKTSRFANDNVLRHVFGPGRSTIDINSVVDEGKILVAYVPESRIGTIAARTISKWLLMQLRDAIMNRRSSTGGWQGMDYGKYEGNSALKADSLEPFFVYVDEFAKFACADFEVLLAEARKKNVGFILSTQTLSQTQVFDIKSGKSGKLEQAIIGNVGSMICYPIGTFDAELMAMQFDVEVEKLKGIRKYRPLARLCIDNQISRPATLEVDLRYEPDNPTAVRRIAKSHALSGAWVEVEGASNKGGFFQVVNPEAR